MRSLLMAIELRQLPNDQIRLVEEIDRSENITIGYEVRDGILVSKTVDWCVPNWSRDPEHAFSVHGVIRQFAAVLERGGVLLGAFEEDGLAGLGILRLRLTDDMAQLALLHVSRAYRRRGVGRMLAEEMFRRARADGAVRIYVSPVPSESAVGFYLSRGFEPTSEVNQELFELEPEDIHMIRDL